eukprot:NODE_5_length_72347_cov_1.339331.p45 type:complete len:184 gc:universal NODE_5_length_72347_cov_1.339331:28396-28947(+)
MSYAKMDDNLDFHAGDYTQKNINQVPPNLVDGNSPSGTIWSLNFYKKYFNVDSHAILKRVRLSFVPNHKLIDEIYDNPDLWGPFWIATSLIILLFVGNSILMLIENTAVQQNYDLSVLYRALSMVYPYVFGMPLVIWIVCRYYSTSTTFFALVDLYGYTLCIWLPIAVFFFNLVLSCYTLLLD